MLNSKLITNFEYNANLEKIQATDDLVQNYFSFVEENLLIRIESIKVDLTKLELELVDKLDTLRETASQKIRNNLETCETCFIPSHAAHLQQKSEAFSLLKLNISKLKTICDEKITMATKNMSDFKVRKSFELPLKSMIGYLNGPPCGLILPELVEKPAIRIVDMSKRLKSVCGLAQIFRHGKYALAVTDFVNSSLNLVENCESFLGAETRITTLTKIKETRFKKYYAICTNSPGNYLYVCDMELHRVLIFDLELHRLKRILSGTGETSRLEFNCPRDICFFGSIVYVLDQGVNSIDTFTEAGDFLRSFMFAESQIENAWSVRVAANRIAIVDWKQKIFLFDFDFSLKYTLMLNEVISVCFVGANDLYCHCENGDFACFNLNNDCESRKKEAVAAAPVVSYRKHFKSLKYRSEFMIYGANQQFILSLGWSKAIAFIDFW